MAELLMQLNQPSFTYSQSSHALSMIIGHYSYCSIQEFINRKDFLGDIIS
jgi:hypothetical protein